MTYSEASALKTYKIFLIFKSSGHSCTPAALMGMLGQFWPPLQLGGLLSDSEFWPVHLSSEIKSLSF